VTEGTTAEAGASGIAAARSEDAGWTGLPPIFPRIQGADACGRIVAVGDGVESQRIGERVWWNGIPCRRNCRPKQSHLFRFGVRRRVRGVRQGACVHAHAVTCGLTDAELASFPCAYAAAENMLTRLNLKLGETVLVTGASGGVVQPRCNWRSAAERRCWRWQALRKRQALRPWERPKSLLRIPIR